jgi:hypothetical protein
MIIDDSGVGRYVFIFDINDAKPFDGLRYTPSHGIGTAFEWSPYKLQHLDNLTAVALFQPMTEWLQDHTSAFRINAVIMIHPFTTATAVLIQVPETLAVLFRMFWYDQS